MYSQVSDVIIKIFYGFCILKKNVALRVPVFPLFPSLTYAWRS